MGYVFEMIDKTGRRIHLTNDKWEHITTKHPEMSSPEKLEEVKQTLANPLTIAPNKYDIMKRNYYWYYKEKKRYLLVAVKYLNGEGHISTAFITRKIIRR